MYPLQTRYTFLGSWKSDAFFSILFHPMNQNKSKNNKNNVKTKGSCENTYELIPTQV